MMWFLVQSAERVGGRLSGADAGCAGVVTGSHGDCRGQLFVALRGERFDGHDAVAKAAENGAAAAVIDRVVDPDTRLWIVDDAGIGIGRLAVGCGDRLPASDIGAVGNGESPSALGGHR